MSRQPIDDRWYRKDLACPDCRSALNASESSLRCNECGYAASEIGAQLQLLPRAPRDFSAPFPRVFDPSLALAGVDLTRPEPAEEAPRAVRDSRELFSALFHARPRGGDLLDLGCGPRDQAPVAAHFGFRYVGLDYDGNEADIRADAHAIPFRDGVFDVVFCYAVLEHLHNPFIALSEIHRVLRPGGCCVGAVSQGEPFHASYFHHTPWGLVSAASFAGLRLSRLWPSVDALHSLSRMGRYSRPTRWGLRFLDWFEGATPFLTPRRWLRWSQKELHWDGCIRAGSLCFLLTRPQDAP